VELPEQHTLQLEQGLSVVVEPENNVAMVRFERQVSYPVELANTLCLWRLEWSTAGSMECLHMGLVVQERAGRIVHTSRQTE
jgi:hypothetical protein